MTALEALAWVYVTIAALVGGVGAVGWDIERDVTYPNRRAVRRYARTALSAPIWPIWTILALVYAAAKGASAIRDMWHDAFTK